MRSMSSTGICDSDGLKGPPTGTPSTVTRSASNSFRPQRPMLARRGPLSDPLAVSRPVTSCSASTTVRAPRRRSSSPVTTDTAPGTLTGSSAPFVAETTTCSVVESGVGAVVGAGACADACLLARRRRKPAAAQAREKRFMFVPFLIFRGTVRRKERISDPGGDLGWPARENRTDGGGRCRGSLGSEGAGPGPLRTRDGHTRTGARRTFAVLLYPVAVLAGAQRSGEPVTSGFLRPPFPLAERQHGRRVARRREDLEGSARRVLGLLAVEAVADREPRAAGGQVRNAPQEHSGARSELGRHADGKLPALDRQEQLELRDSPRKSPPLDLRRFPRPHRPEGGRGDGNLRGEPAARRGQEDQTEGKASHGAGIITGSRGNSIGSVP